MGKYQKYQIRKVIKKCSKYQKIILKMPKCFKWQR